jgi:hypothetical protein
MGSGASRNPSHDHAIPDPLEDELVLGNNGLHYLPLQLVQTASSTFETKSVQIKNRKQG